MRKYTLSIVIGILLTFTVYSINAQQPSTTESSIEIYHRYCSPISRNTHETLNVFARLCQSSQIAQCCNEVGNKIAASPGVPLCLDNSQYNFCPQLGTRGSFNDNRDIIYFPVEKEPANVAQIAFSTNPKNNVQVTIAGESNQLKQPLPVPSPAAAPQPVPPPKQLSPAPLTSAAINENNEEDRPAVFKDTRGYLAMDFALNLFKSIDRPSHGDAVISPILPQQLLSNLVDVASPQAANELIRAIQVHPDELSELGRRLRRYSGGANTVETGAVNILAQDLHLNKTFEQVSKQRNFEVLRVDFGKTESAARKINNWVSEKTHRFINEIVNPSNLSPYTRLILANSIYFKGKWKYSFIQTDSSPFEISSGNSKQVNMMFQFNKLRSGVINLSRGQGLNWVELPYEGDQLAMLIMVPTQRHQLKASLEQLYSEDLAKVLADMNKSYIDTKVHLYLPRFTLTDTVSLIPALERLGVSSIFQDGDALRYLTKEDTVVSDVTQRSYLSVDELGTKATSVASLSIVTLSLTPQYRDVVFRVDEPFLAMIVDKNERYPFFIAQVYEPKE